VPLRNCSLTRQLVDSVVAMETAAVADPELTIETEMPTIDSFIAPEVLRGLKKKERKRQDVINGNYACRF